MALTLHRRRRHHSTKAPKMPLPPSSSSESPKFRAPLFTTQKGKRAPGAISFANVLVASAAKHFVESGEPLIHYFFFKYVPVIAHEALS